MATLSKGPLWGDHKQGGKHYTLGHLHPVVVDWITPAVLPTRSKPGRAEIKTKLRFSYSHHCFTQAMDKFQNSTDETLYRCETRRETRVFCTDRWTESKRLPEVIAALPSANCYFTRHHNYFVVRDASNPLLGDYFVYFVVRLHESGIVDIFVESAYPRLDGARQRKSASRISFTVLVVNAIRGVGVKRPPTYST